MSYLHVLSTTAVLQELVGWLGVPFLLGPVSLLLVGAPWESHPRNREAWGFLLGGIAVGWFLGGFPT